MSPSLAENTNFYWHCRVAVKIIDELPDSTVRNRYAADAVRMATLCAVGKHGVQYASDAARVQRDRIGKGVDWEKCKLRKEHVIPVRLVHTYVLDELKATQNSASPAPSLVRTDPDTQWLAPNIVEDFKQHPRAWQAAQIIYAWTLLAWITTGKDGEDGEDERFKAKGLVSSMPMGWTPDQDKLERYRVCGINVSRI